MGTKALIFQISPSADLEAVWHLLEEDGCHLLYSDTDENTQKIFGHLPSECPRDFFLKDYPEILAIDDTELPDIDWEAQWAAHSNYHGGFLSVDLKDYAPQISFNSWSSLIRLTSGPGFGDLSHPTTRLVLRLMPSFIQDRAVIDMGCGSGILSIAAVSLGAFSVIGIDLDPAALVHSNVNSLENGMEGRISFFLPQQVKHVENETVVLMNMIQSEQVVAWESLASFSSSISIVVSSGILCEAREDYLKEVKKLGWKLVEELQEEAWLGFVFKTVS